MKIDIEKFLFCYTNTFKPLNQDQKEGLVELLGFIEADEKITDIRWASYMLATVLHECARTWRPIEEYGKGKGLKYGTPSPTTKHVYYGRGYVQLTWEGNYKTIGGKIGHDLHNHPELALVPEVAYKIMSYGMRNGTFTGASLSKWINADKCDYVNARRIINGTDCAEKIAKMADDFEGILKETCEVT